MSSGDSGYSAGAQFPASSEWVTAVGGTSLYRSGTSFTESVWSGAGSGCSAVYARPSWQHDPLCSKRMVADVSAVGDPSTGVAVYGPVIPGLSGWMVFGGTSVGAPLIAAIYGVNGQFVHYGSDPYSYAGAIWPYSTNPYLHVIVSGSNGSTCGGTYLCTASSSWNYNGPTGLGTPKTVAAFK